MYLIMTSPHTGFRYHNVIRNGSIFMACRNNIPFKRMFYYSLGNDVNIISELGKQ